MVKRGIISSNKHEKRIKIVATNAQVVDMVQETNGAATTSLDPDIFIVKSTLNKEKLRSFPGNIEPMTILVGREEECLLLWGTCHIQAIIGEATVNLYKLKAGPYKKERGTLVSAPHRLGCPISISIQASTAIEKESRVLNRIQEVCSPDTAQKILALWNQSKLNTAILVILRRPPKLFNILSSLYERNIMAPLQNGLMVDVVLDTCFSFYDDLSSKRVKKLISAIGVSCAKNIASSVMTMGVANSGKSTFARLLANALLSMECAGDIWLLDCDIGQSEMGPPGCTTLSRLNGPVLTPPFAHQPCFLEHAYFYGDVKLESTNAIKIMITRHIEYWKKSRKPNSVIIANTMGFVVGEGREILEHIFKQLEPTKCVVFGDSSLLRLDRRSQCDTIAVKKPEGTYQQHPSVKNSLLREATILGHLCHMLTSQTRWHLSSLCKIAPFSIDFRNICFCIPEEQSCLVDEVLFGSFNSTLVALCFYENEHLAPKARRVCNVSTMPLLRIYSPSDREPLRILGFGIIRGIDLDLEVLYLITPVPSNQLHLVTCLVRPINISLPSAIITSQSTTAPYLTQVALSLAANVEHGMFKPIEKSAGLKRANMGKR